MKEWKKQEKVKAKIKDKRKEDEMNNGNSIGFTFSPFLSHRSSDIQRRKRKKKKKIKNLFNLAR